LTDKYETTIVGAFQLVGYKTGEDGKCEGFILDEILTNQKNARQFFIDADDIIDAKTFKFLSKTLQDTKTYKSLAKTLQHSTTNYEDLKFAECKTCGKMKPVSGNDDGKECDLCWRKRKKIIVIKSEKIGVKK